MATAAPAGMAVMEIDLGNVDEAAEKQPPACTRACNAIRATAPKWVPGAVFIVVLSVLASTRALATALPSSSNGDNMSGFHPAVAIATVCAAASSWFDQTGTGWGIEFTALMVMAVLSVTSTLTASEVVLGAGQSDVWIVWCAAHVGASCNALKVGDYLIVRVLKPGLSFSSLIFRIAVMGFVLALLVPSGIARNMMVAPLSTVITDVCDLNQMQVR